MRTVSPLVAWTSGLVATAALFSFAFSDLLWPASTPVPGAPADATRGELEVSGGAAEPALIDAPGPDARTSSAPLVESSSRPQTELVPEGTAPPGTMESLNPSGGRARWQLPSLTRCLESQDLNPHRLVLSAEAREQLAAQVAESQALLDRLAEERTEAISAALSDRISRGQLERPSAGSPSGRRAVGSDVVAGRSVLQFDAGQAVGPAQTVQIRVGEDPGIDGMTSDLSREYQEALARIRSTIGHLGS